LKHLKFLYFSTDLETGSLVGLLPVNVAGNAPDPGSEKTGAEAKTGLRSQPAKSREITTLRKQVTIVVKFL
jgi:hypothetical protein